jgi:hypothetical protein
MMLRNRVNFLSLANLMGFFRLNFRAASPQAQWLEMWQHEQY